MLCILLLRGPQTPGRLRTRSNRLCKFSDVQETESVLQRLMERQEGPFVVRLAREPGKRESRYAHFFSSVAEMASTCESVMNDQSAPRDPAQSIEQLAALITELQEQLNKLVARVDRLDENSKV